MEVFGVNSNFSDNKEMKQHYQRFAKQLSDWYCSEKTPELASQDTRFTLELQKQKRREKNKKEVEGREVPKHSP